ncbi:MAG: chromosomal replication initiator protein DnaA [Pseudomonadota bacterium]
MSAELWQQCLKKLENELSAQDFNTWIRPLQAIQEEGAVHLLAPNRFVLDWVKNNFLTRIVELLTRLNHGQCPTIQMHVGSRRPIPATKKKAAAVPTAKIILEETKAKAHEPSLYQSPLNPKYTFQNFVTGRSNQLACAASKRVAAPRDSHEENEFNPLFIYGGVGLGKTHLMQAIGNCLLKDRPSAKVVYLHSERFVMEMVRALQTNKIDGFKRFIRSVNVLLIDDIQFLAGKTRSQEEFLYTFNSLIEEHQQVILTCDRMPREINGLEERLRSRFGCGLTVSVDSPELETRTEILRAKAHQAELELPDEVAYYIAEHVESNIRELEGAFNRLAASAKFMDEKITLDFSQDVLKDLLKPQKIVLSIEDIQNTVADYFKINVVDLHSKSRQRVIVRPRQIAMALSKELTQQSLPTIGSAFGGRDRTTVLHSCKTIDNLITKDNQLKQDYANLHSILSKSN